MNLVESLEEQLWGIHNQSSKENQQLAQSPLFDAWKESRGGIFSIWAESLDELSKFVSSLIFSTAYLCRGNL